MTIRARRLAFAACALAIAFPTLAQTAAKAPITHEDVWLQKRVGAPTISPDGKWAAFGVTEPAYDEKQQSSDLWIVPVDGGAAPRRLTSTSAGEGGLAWSPDSTRLAFTTKRDGDEATQVYVLDLAHGRRGAARDVAQHRGACPPVEPRRDATALLE